MFRRKRKTSDFAAEIEAHLQLETESLREQGLSDEEARYAALRAFGNVTRTPKENCILPVDGRCVSTLSRTRVDLGFGASTTLSSARLPATLLWSALKEAHPPS